jgi:hypothetical protein
MLMKNNKKTNNISTNNNTNCDKKYMHPKKSINNSNILTNDNTIYYIEKTDMPDVFNLFTFNKQMNLYEKVDIAYIPNIKTSKFMRELFKDQNIITKLKMKCFAINKNNKTRWVPTELVK